MAVAVQASLQVNLVKDARISCGIKSKNVVLCKNSFVGDQSRLKGIRAVTSSRTSLPRVSAILDDDDDILNLDPQEVEAAYIALYGDPDDRGTGEALVFAGSGGELEQEPDARRGRGRGKEEGDDDAPTGGRINDEFQESVVEVRRVTKVVKGGKQLSFRAVVVVGDKKGKAGVGVGKAKEVSIAVQKAALDARRHLVSIPLTNELTFPHRADGRFGAAKVMLRPAAIGTGVIAGGSVRTVLELAGVENALGKQLGSKNHLNNARAVLDAVSNMKKFEEVAKQRGLTVKQLWE